MTAKRIEIDRPYFEDFTRGEFLEQPPAVTVTTGHTAFHQALFGDRLRLPLDAHLSEAVTGTPQPVVNASLLCNIAIGQTTYASQLVKANLFYRGLMIKKPVHVGDTLYTTTQVVGLRQNTVKPGRAATGVVVLEMTVTNQRGEEVMRFWRCPMIPCRDPNADTGIRDSFDSIPAELDADMLAATIPSSWNLDAYKERVQAPHFDDIDTETTFVVGSRDTVTLAPELVRLTLNMATTHTDAKSSVYGKRLVYGGHTIAMAGAQIARALPGLVGLVGWRKCDHTAPVFEQDILRSEVTVVHKTPRSGGGGFVDLHVEVFAERGEEAPEPGTDIKVLDWDVVGFMA